MLSLPLNTSYKYHTLIAFIISVWLVMFLILIAPFDIAELTFTARLQILPIYGIMTFVVYMALVPLQNWVVTYLKKWTLASETFFILGFNLILITVSYSYYKSNIVNGNYGFQSFVLEIYLPIFFILLPIIVLSRWFLNKKVPNKNSNTILLKGDNKLDVLHINLEDLICISSADNYVEVSYLKNGELHKKLLRNTLKGVEKNHQNLLKVHRSHIINPIHFKEWKGNKKIVLTKTEVPVSKKYRTAVLDMNQLSLKPNALSQTQ